tara:strand:- start:7667 stop:8410 length:744 start_codon:yes stop_codon:yes gene_type:complete
VSLLTIDQLTVKFGGHTALHDVSMSITEGKITGLIGPNGAGKTTLFNVVSGLQRPHKGQILLDGKVITNNAPYKRAREGIGRTFQRLELFPSLTVSENLRVAGEIRNQWPKNRKASNSTKTINKRIDEILMQTGLGNLANHHVAEIPTGKARLVELGRSLMQNPRLILLDEPASGQNDEETAEFGDILLNLKDNGITVFLVEHDMSLVMAVCDDVYVLDFGTIIANGSTEQIQNDPTVINAYLGDST